MKFGINSKNLRLHVKKTIKYQERDLSKRILYLQTLLKYIKKW